MIPPPTPNTKATPTTTASARPTVFSVGVSEPMPSGVVTATTGLWPLTTGAASRNAGVASR